MHLDYTVDFVLAKVGKRDIVAKQKRKSAVIIFKIKRFTHTLRQLVNKAKNTFVTAAFLLIHKVCFKFKTDFFVFTLVNLNCSYIAVPILDFKSKISVYLMKAIITESWARVTVYRAKQMLLDAMKGDETHEERL